MTPEQQKAEAERLALASEVEAAKKRLAEKEAALLAGAKPVITEFNGFQNIQNGTAVGPFVIRGENLGRTTANGVTINGHIAKVTAIRATSIKGIIPLDVKVGDAVIKVGEATFSAKISA